MDKGSFGLISGLGRKSAMIVVLAGTLAACASSGPDAFYGLTAPDAPAGVSTRAKGAQVLVAPPKALQALDTSSIAVVDAGPVYTYLPKVAWTDTLPNVVQAKIVETLENTGRLRGVGVPGEGLLIDYQLQTELRSFEVRIDGQDRAVVEVMARLVNDRNGRTKASKLFRAQAPASVSSASKAVEGVNRAAQQVLDEMSRWVLSQV